MHDDPELGPTTEEVASPARMHAPAPAPLFASASRPLTAGVLPPVRPSRTQLVLFAATVVSTLVMYPLWQESTPFADRAITVQTVLFSFTLLTILTVHEMGHFLVARRYGVAVSLPYLIPAPNLLGTFGAVIRIRSPITDRRALLMIGAAGPIAGFLVAVPAVVWGIAQSTPAPIGTGSGLVVGGSPLFLWVVERLHGALVPGQGIELSGMAFAGWAGLLLTAINLLPLGQLDGGHVIYALLGTRSRWVAVPVMALLLVLGLLLWPGWAFIGLLAVIFGLRHPPVVDPGVPLALHHRLVALATLVIMALSFTPVPIAWV